MTKMTAEQLAAQIESEITGRESDWADGHDCASRAAARMIRFHLIETDEQRRERFEAWRGSRYTWCPPDAMARNDAGEYMYLNVRAQFEIWQAALTWRGETKGGE